MASSVVGIDIGSVAIRAVELKDPDKARPTVLRFGEIPLPEGAVARGEVIEQRTVASSLKRLWSTAGFGSKEVVIGMGNQRVLARDLTLPRMSITRIRESLPYQVQDHLPVPVEEALLDFYPISEAMSDSGPVVNGLLIAAIKEAVLGNVRAVELAGLTTSGVDLVPFALSRLLLGTAASEGAGIVTEAVVEIGATATTVVISTRGVPQFLRIIPSGGEDVTEALKLRLELERGEAETLKRFVGLTTRVVDPWHVPAMNIINEVASDLLGSIRNTVAYFTHTRPDSILQRIQLCGGGSFLRGLPEALAELTRLPVAPVDVLAGLAIARGVDAKGLHARQAEFTVALGLAVGVQDAHAGRAAA
ncbi:type IV pilus assembly protein PilM [Labedella phragmitis]|uniref:Type IV pilus assembly protein PilM n=1 Tax=Labedella phragmitis TaxID=2498849 RepID=A0A444PRY1_9MICO|nr:type IV pilus assembly protein PilM [Labedella phragmitis]RWZ50031.1 type IV pilus assembly protein PilM [Labedella phragmitis]